jgi:hypothetical protein
MESLTRKVLIRRSILCIQFCERQMDLIYYPYVTGISQSDSDRVTDLAGWIWGTLYQDDILNRLAIGRFLREFLDVLHPAVHNSPLPPPSSAFSFISPKSPQESSANSEHAKMMIFSGHDSTLVPILCALGIYDGTRFSQL